MKSNMQQVKSLIYTRYHYPNISQHGVQKDDINCIEFSKDLEILITGSDDERIRIYNVLKNKLIVKLNGHTGPIRCISLSNENKLFASGAKDNLLKIWKFRKANCIMTLTGHTKSVECIKFSKDANYIFSGSWDRKVIMWDLWQEGIIIKTIDGHQSLVQSIAFNNEYNRMATGCWDLYVRFWKFDKITAIGEGTKLKGHKGRVNCVAFSKHGILASGSNDRCIILWNPTKNAILYILKGHGSWIRCLTFKYTGLVLSSIADDDSIKFWDVAIGKNIQTIDIADVNALKICKFTNNSNLIIAGSKSVLKIY